MALDADRSRPREQRRRQRAPARPAATRGRELADAETECGGYRSIRLGPLGELPEESSYVGNQEVRFFQSGETAAAAELVHWTILFVRSAMYRNGMKFSYGNTANVAGADDGSGDAPQ
jgi:hypothetical protein